MKQAGKKIVKIQRRSREYWC